MVEGCRFSCDPGRPGPDCPDAARHDGASTRPARLVELPVGATEDRVIGALDLQQALGSGTVTYEPGLLAAAHRGILYVDEVNLLHDHLVDLLLDAAATGRSTVEREGVSVSHASRIVLIGTMNPEEGELRPQLLDRFGLTVEIAAPRDPALRAEVIRRRMDFDRDPDTFTGAYADAEAALGRGSPPPATRLRDVRLTDEQRLTIAGGLRGVRGGRAAGRHRHRPGRRRPRRLARPGRGDHRGHPGRRPAGPAPPPAAQPVRRARAWTRTCWTSCWTSTSRSPDPSRRRAGRWQRLRRPRPPSPETCQKLSDAMDALSILTSRRCQPRAGRTYRARLFTAAGVGAGEAGRRSRAITDSGVRSAPSSPRGRPGPLHLPATIRAAAPEQAGRGRSAAQPLRLARPDLRLAVTEGRESNLVLLVVDASGSMAARRRMEAVKAAALSLLLDAYQRRDKVGLITFRGAEATLALPPTSSIDVAARRLRELPSGGRTPLAEGLLCAADTLRRERIRDPRRRPLLVVVTDGRATHGPDAVARSRQVADRLRADGIASVVIDCETGKLRLGLAAALSDHLGAEYVPVGEVAADQVLSAVRQTLPERPGAA